MFLVGMPIRILCDDLHSSTVWQTTYFYENFDKGAWKE